MGQVVIRNLNPFEKTIFYLCKGTIQHIIDEHLHVAGIIKTHALPFGDDMEEYRHWWLPETAIINGCIKTLRPARMTRKDKEKFQVHETSNILTTNGRNYALSYLGSSAALAAPFAQYFAVGTFPVIQVFPGDTTVQTEVLRIAPSSTSITGTQIDIETVIGTSQINNTQLTNAGLFGLSATASAGSGTLMTHTLYNFLKGTGVAYAIDYLINLT